ncbi:hypothetical protein E2C01_045559 [Portunus trituberculatus]|uniref:Uncharacterized protein n=1 Tax=Portunus trituberculatus TaxID=210409 RepID=A0A5B7G2C4_PORTR|nr:hypothetical protein [Portunus trituberculatus]
MTGGAGRGGAAESIGITMETHSGVRAGAAEGCVEQRGESPEKVGCVGREQVCGNMIWDWPHARAAEHPPVYF